MCNTKLLAVARKRRTGPPNAVAALFTAVAAGAGRVTEESFYR